MVDSDKVTIQLKRPSEEDRGAALAYSKEVEPGASYCLGAIGFDTWLRMVMLNRHDLYLIYKEDEIIGTIENQKRLSLAREHQHRASIIEKEVRRAMDDIERTERISKACFN